MITVPDRGKRTYAVRYANGGTIDRPIEVLLNGKAIAELPLSPGAGTFGPRRSRRPCRREITSSDSSPSAPPTCSSTGSTPATAVLHARRLHLVRARSPDDRLAAQHGRGRVPATTAEAPPRWRSSAIPTARSSAIRSPGTAPPPRDHRPAMARRVERIFFADFIFAGCGSRLDADGEALAVDNFYNAAGQITRSRTTRIPGRCSRPAGATAPFESSRPRPIPPTSVATERWTPISASARRMEHERPRRPRRRRCERVDSV